MRLFLLASCALAGALALAACSARPEPQAVAPAVAPSVVEVAKPSPGTGPAFATGVGRLAADDEAALAFTAAGVVAGIEVERGDAVRPGQTLARLDATVLDATAREADEQVRQAERDLARVEGLVARQLVPRQQRDDALTRLDVARARLRAARFGQRYGRIVAPAAGTVLARLAEPGEVVAAGQPVLRVSGAASGWILTVTLADRDGLRVRNGAPAQVHFDALPGTVLSATVVRVAGEASATSGGIVIELGVAGQGLPLRSGLVGKARITLDDAPAELQIPTSALLDAGAEGGQVFVVEDGVARRRGVRLGEVRGEGVAVLGGLAADDVVVVGGAAFLEDGMAVTVEARP